MKKRIVLLVLASILVIFTLIEYIFSFGNYNDGGYRGFYFDTDYLILFLTSCSILGISIVNLVSNKKGINYSKGIQIASIAVVGFNACYGLFTMLKVIAKEVANLWENEAVNLAYSDISTYLIWGLASAAICVYLILNFIEKHKNNVLE